MLHLRFHRLGPEAIADLETLQQHCQEPLDRVAKSGVVHLEIASAEAALAVWPFVRKWGRKEQIAKLRTQLAEAGLRPPVVPVTPESRIALLDLDPRSRASFKRAGFKKVEDLTSRRAKELWAFDDIGPGAIRAARAALREHGLYLLGEEK